jgi:hypothetical protein
MRKTLSRITISLLLLLAATVQVNGQLALQCNPPYWGERLTDTTFVAPGSAAETARMHQSPHGAARTGKHTLLVHWDGGTQTFRNKPPYDEPLDGIRWTYCGYSTKVGLHLVMKGDFSVFTGVLVDEKTGSILPGGHAVTFSPDLMLYIAYEQPDGQDGETMKLYDRNGTLLWKGISNVSSPDGQSILAEFDDVHWDSTGKLIAAYQDPEQRKKFLTLTQSSNGHWRWIPGKPN